MTDHQILSNETHRDHKIITKRSNALGDGVMHAMTFPLEFTAIQSHYPIFFCKDSATENFYPTALFSLEENENLFLENDIWTAKYIPMMVEKGPFLIGFQPSEEHDDDKDNPVVAVDMSSPRVSLTTGQSLFDESGRPTDFLKDTVKLLDTIHSGHEQNKHFISSLLENDLLESCTIKLSLVDGSQRELIDFFTINEKKLGELDGLTLQTLNSENYLRAIFMVIASHSRVTSLIDKKNAILLQDAARPTH